MKVLYCASEALPFAATGGLADVAGSLPAALRRRLIGCRVALPLYSSVPQELRDTMTFITSISVPVAWRRQYCGIYEARYNGVIYYLLDNQYYFRREGGFYGHFDDAERFAFFSRAVIEMLPHIDFKPDVIHANDWQLALVPIYFDLFYANNDWYKGIKTLFTIHNIQYQGKYGFEIMEDVFGIPASRKDLVAFDDCLNLMKGAIETAHRVSTVSPTYAEEILDPWYSHGLHPILQQRKWKLSGILNGIDTDSYDCEKDPQIPQNFSAEDLSGKAVCKQYLQERLGLVQDPNAPLVGMVSRLVSHKGLDLVKARLDHLMNTTDMQFAVLGSGDYEYENFFREMAARYPGRFSVTIAFVPELSRKIYAGADLFLMPSKSEPCGLSQMIALRYGTLPIVRETGGLKDSIHDCGDGEGNGFTFKTYNADDMADAILRAVAAYKDPELRVTLQKRAIGCDNSWGRSANEYIRLYKQMLAED